MPEAHNCLINVRWKEVGGGVGWQHQSLGLPWPRQIPWAFGDLETYSVFLSLLPCKVLTILAPSLGSPGREGPIAPPTRFRGLGASIHMVKGSGEFS